MATAVNPSVAGVATVAWGRKNAPMPTTVTGVRRASVGPESVTMALDSLCLSA